MIKFKVPINQIPYIDFPEIKISKTESVVIIQNVHSILFINN